MGAVVMPALEANNGSSKQMEKPSCTCCVAAASAWLQAVHVFFACYAQH